MAHRNVGSLVGPEADSAADAQQLLLLSANCFHENPGLISCMSWGLGIFMNVLIKVEVRWTEEVKVSDEAKEGKRLLLHLPFCSNVLHLSFS